LLIAQISDTHLLPPASDQPAASLRADCLRRCVADINQQKPDAVVFTGDTVQHGQPDEYALLRELLAPLEAPLYLVPGNRDNKDALRVAFNDHPQLPKNGEFLHYVVDDNDVRLVGIDSTLAGERKGRFCEARQAWLEAARALADIVGRYSQVAGLLCGHVHWPIEREWAGTSARIMPSVAVDVRKGIDETEAQQRPIYMLHRLSGEAGLASEARMVDASDSDGSIPEHAG
jgi:3',5'-cyclic AMP phosphodiesterase CpdA